MRNWELENITKKHLIGCYVEPEIKERIKALARARRISISALTRELIELALPQAEQLAQQQTEQLAERQPENDLSVSP